VVVANLSLGVQQSFAFHNVQANYHCYCEEHRTINANKSPAVAEMGDRLATVDMDRKVGGRCPPLGGGELYPHLTHCGLGRSLASIPSGILIHPTAWPQYTNVTDRTDRQRSDSILGRTVLQTVAQQDGGLFPSY